MSDRDGVEVVWPGKYDAHGRRAPIARRRFRSHVEAIYGAERHRGAAGSETTVDRLLFGDNLAALDALRGEFAGKIDLVYIDPPFGTGGRFTVATRVGEADGNNPPPELASIAYSDRWEGKTGGFLQMLDARLRLIYELLSPHASLYVHVDPTVGHAVKLLLDEVFGPRSFQREIVWRIGWVSGFKTQARNWIRNHDLIYFYTKDPKRFTFNKIYVPYPEGYRRRDGSPPKGVGMPIDDVWNANPVELGLSGTDSLDSIQIKSFSTEKSGYATQKNLSVLRRIIAASSNPGDTVADLFCGSGSTLVAAAELGRRFVGCDCQGAAIHIATKRLLDVPRQRELRIEHVVDLDREKPAIDEVLAAYGAEPTAESQFHGRVGKRAVFIVPNGTTVDSPLVRSVIERALAREVRAIDLVGRSFELPLDRSEANPVEVAYVRMIDEVVGDGVKHDARLRFVQLPSLDLSLSGLDEGSCRAVLRDVAYSQADRLAPQAARIVSVGIDWIDFWSVAWEAASLRVDDVAFRTHQRRALELELGPHRYRGRGPFHLKIALVDILWQRTEVEIELQRGPSGELRIASAVQR